MIPEPPSADLVQFAEIAGINLVYIQVENIKWILTLQLASKRSSILNGSLLIPDL